MNKKILTLCFVRVRGRILLGMKKRGFGEGRWNGFGGKVEIGESLEDAARREFFEEAGIQVFDLKKRGVIEFYFQNDDSALEVNVFEALSFLGEPCETEEMRPFWFLEKEIPYDLMWPDDKFWMPIFLQGKNFKARFDFKDNNVILNNFVEEVSEL